MLRDTWLIFTRDVKLSSRNPAWILVGVLQPLLYLVLFGPLMVTVVEHTPGFPPGDAWTVLIPALIVQNALFSGAFAGLGLLAEYRAGVVDRLRVTPSSRASLLLGKVVTNVVQAVAQSLLIILVAGVFFRIDASFVGIALSLAIIALLAAALGAASQALAISLKNETVFPSLLNMVLLPLVLISGILIPITVELAPGWLYIISQLNPLTHVVSAERAAFRGDLNPGVLVFDCGILLVMAMLAVFWGVRAFAKDHT